MTTLALVLLFLLPIPFAFMLEPANGGDNFDRTRARGLRRRLIWIGSMLAALTIGHHAILLWLDADGIASERTPWRPEALAIWIPWVLLARYKRLLHDDPEGEGTLAATRRYASLRPRRAPRTLLIAWSVVGSGWLVGASIMGARAARVADPWTPLLLVLLTPAWLTIGVLLTTGGSIRDPEPFPRAEEDRRLRRAYRRRRALASWSVFAAFSTIGLGHSSIAASMLWGSSHLLIASSAGIALTIIAIAAVHWRQRARVDDEIDKHRSRLGGPTIKDR